MGSVLRSGALLGALLAAPGALASSDIPPELDRLVSASADVATGIAFARALGADGDLVGAAATLERVLLLHPEADEVRLMHAGLLCRLDDPDGARAEVAELAGRTVDETLWAELDASCGPSVRSGGKQGA